MVKYHKTFGKIEVLNSNEKTTLIKVSATGQEKKCSTGLLMNLISDTPFSDDQINEGSLIINSSKKRKDKNEIYIHRKKRYTKRFRSWIG